MPQSPWIIGSMRTNHRSTLLALTASGLLWGTTVPLSKVALTGMSPAWLTVARFALAVLPLAWVGRRHLRRAVSPGILVSGVTGYGAVIVLQNAGIQRTSVSHAALLIGAMPVLVALLMVALGRSRVGPVAWLGFALGLGGVALVAVIGADAGSTATLAGDALVVLSLLFSAVFMVTQPRLLSGRDPVAVTAVQLAAAAVGTLPVALALDGVPPTAPGLAPTAAMIGLAIGGTLVPFTLFAWAQARVSPEIAGAFLNLEPLVGVALGVLAFGDPVAPAQAAGATAILLGIALTAVRRRKAPVDLAVVVPIKAGQTRRNPAPQLQDQRVAA